LEEERKVTGIDLEELKRAREEMYQEMGISSAPTNSINNEQEDAHKNEENIDADEQIIEPDEETDDFDSSSIIENQLLGMIDNFINNAEAESSESQTDDKGQSIDKDFMVQSKPSINIDNKNLSHYDAFAQFEINTADAINEKFATKAQTDEETFGDAVVEDRLVYEVPENIASELLLDEDDDDDDEIEVDDELLDSLEEIAEDLARDIEQTKEKLAGDKANDVVEAEDLKQFEEDSIEEPQEPQEEIEISPVQQQEVVQEKEPEAQKIASKPKQVENAAINFDFFHSEPVKVSQELLPEIDSVNFVNVLSMQEFKQSDNFTFVLGKTESGNVLFESLKQCYNIAFFANENSYELLNTMLLSFMLKNSHNEFKFVLCDGANSNNFAYYETSKYLYDGKISKNEDDISQVLNDVFAELEKRYHTLAKFNVKSIDEYNILATNTNTPRLSQILIVIDGYYELMQSSNFEKIKTTLYQILRLGRIAGIYAVVVTNQKIEEDIINFNLPSRIGFKCHQNEDSISMIGESGIDKLASKNEYFYSSINLEHAVHLRQPTISGSIIKILIDNIEK